MTKIGKNRFLFFRPKFPIFDLWAALMTSKPTALNICLLFNFFLRKCGGKLNWGIDLYLAVHLK